MNVRLDKRLGRILFVVEQRLSLEETRKFRDAAFKAEDFDELPQPYKELALEIEKSDPPPERLFD
jgi:hypothetical protein